MMSRGHIPPSLESVYASAPFIEAVLFPNGGKAVVSAVPSLQPLVKSCWDLLIWLTWPRAHSLASHRGPRPEYEAQECQVTCQSWIWLEEDGRVNSILSMGRGRERWFPGEKQGCYWKEGEEMQSGNVTDPIAVIHTGRQMCPLDRPFRLVEAGILGSSGTCWRSEGEHRSRRSEKLELPKGHVQFCLWLVRTLASLPVLPQLREKNAQQSPQLN